MRVMAIPSWTPAGVLPPNNPAAPASPERSPYSVALTDLILRFNASPDRQAILTGLLDFRRALHEIGLVSGFQWLDGSFLEDVEATESRAPRDIDVVTFYALPEGQTQAGLLQQAASLFDPRSTKRTYHVDAYSVQLDGDSPEWLVRQSAYWYSVWSHRRDGLWKGYLEVDLNPASDERAREYCSRNAGLGGQP